MQISIRKTPIFLMFILILLSLIIRVIAYPSTTMWEPDALVRTWIAIDWIQEPTLLRSGVWGPGHVYFSALAALITGDPFEGPIALNVLLSVLTSIPIYLVTQQLFKDSRASLFVAAVYLLYPVMIRSSYVNMPEPLSVFLLATAYLFVVRAHSPEGTVYDAAIAGICLTLAASLRFEIWLYIPLFALHILRKPFSFLSFSITALIFPVFWMISGYLEQGDLFYSASQSRQWELVIEATVLDLTDVIKQVGFYPASVILGTTPFVALMLIIGIVLALYQRKPQSLWLIAPVIMALLITANAASGSLTTKSRYTLPFVILLLPFIAPAFERLIRWRWGTMSTSLILLTIIPLSYLGNYGTPELISDFYISNINAFPQEMNNVDNAALARLTTALTAEITEDIAIISDFYGWGATFNVLYNTRLERGRVFVAPGGKNQPIEREHAEKVLAAYPQGLLIIQTESRFAEEIKFDVDEERAEFMGRMLQLDFLSEHFISDQGLMLYSYDTIK